jgi:hypothetical protein
MVETFEFRKGRKNETVISNGQKHLLGLVKILAVKEGGPILMPTLD